MNIRMKLILGVLLVIIVTVSFSTFGVSLLVERQNDRNSRSLVIRTADQTRRIIDDLKNRALKRVTDFASNPSNLINMRYMLEIKGRKNVGAYKFILERPKEEMVLALADLAREEGFDSFYVYDGRGDMVLYLESRGELFEAGFATYDEDGSDIVKYCLLEQSLGAENRWREQSPAPGPMNHLSSPLPLKTDFRFDNIRNTVTMVGLVPFSSKRTLNNTHDVTYSEKEGEVLGCVLFHKILGEAFADSLRREVETEVNIFAGRDFSCGTLIHFTEIPEDLWSLYRSPVPEEGRELDVRVGSVGGEEYYQAFLPLFDKSLFVGAIGLSLSRSDTLRKSRETILLLVSIMGICILGAVPVAILLAERISSRLDDILLAVHEIRGGDLSARAAITSGDELGRLAAAFNEMAEDLHGHVEKLKESEEKYRNLFDFAPDGIMITTYEGEILSFNETILKIFDYEDREAFGRLSARDFYVDPGKDRTVLLDKLMEEGWLESHEVLFKDRLGKHFTAGLALRLIQYEGKSAIQTVMRDITRIKAMEGELRDYSANLERMVEAKTAELTEANQQLREAYGRAGMMISELEKTQEALEHSYSELASANRDLEDTREQLALSAHQAGMAEIAVSLLHNIGNAVNSVNIRTHSMEQAATYREIGLLDKLCDFLKSPPVSVAEGRLEGEVRENLLKYVQAITESCARSRDSLKVNAEFIRKGLDHIMEIIALQQEYAGVRGFEAPADINHLLRDSVEMLWDSVHTRQIAIQFDLGAIPPIVINKNKMMQVFINIVKNAYEAIDEAGPEAERKITLSTTVDKQDDVSHVRIVIADTGIGLEPDAFEKVFRFDYSTKGRGTGFGLHDAANYVHAQNGSIEILSEGRGKGARLVIDLPVSKPVKEIVRRDDYSLVKIDLA